MEVTKVNITFADVIHRAAVTQWLASQGLAYNRDWFITVWFSPEDEVHGTRFLFANASDASAFALRWQGQLE